MWVPDWWSWTALAVGLLAAGALIPVIWLIVRRRWLAGKGRIFECSLKRPGAGWTLGVARFRGNDLEWYRVFSLSLRPRVTFHRHETRVLTVRKPTASESTELYDGHLVTELAGHNAGYLLAMSRPDLTAFSSWTEAGAPGRSSGGDPFS